MPDYRKVISNAANSTYEYVSTNKRKVAVGAAAVAGVAGFAYFFPAALAVAGTFVVSGFVSATSTLAGMLPASLGSAATGIAAAVVGISTIAVVGLTYYFGKKYWNPNVPAEQKLSTAEGEEQEEGNDNNGEGQSHEPLLNAKAPAPTPTTPAPGLDNADLSEDSGVQPKM